MSFELDYEGGAEVLKEMAAQHIGELTRQVAASSGDDAEFEMFTTDRIGGSVRVPAEQQARDGVLTRAAAAAGLEVRST